MSENNSENEQGCISTILLIIIGVILLPSVPFLLLILAIGAYVELKKIEKNYPNKSISDFWLSEEEQQTFVSVNDKCVDATNTIYKSKQAGKEENIGINNDGSFSNRSYRGKELNNLITENENIWKKYNQILKTKKIEPYLKWENTKSDYSRNKGMLYSIVIWLITFTVTVVKFFEKPYYKPFIDFYKTYVVGKESFFSLTKSHWEMIFVFLVPLVVVYIFYHIIKGISSFIFKKKYPKPPFVTIKNYKSY